MDNVRTATETSNVAHDLCDSLKKVRRDYRVGISEGQDIATGGASSGVSNP
jgi:hypothetical protein